MNPYLRRLADGRPKRWEQITIQNDLHLRYRNERISTSGVFGQEAGRGCIANVSPLRYGCRYGFSTSTAVLDTYFNWPPWKFAPTPFDVCRELTNEKKSVEIRCGADKRTEEETAAFFVSNGTS